MSLPRALRRDFIFVDGRIRRGLGYLRRVRAASDWSCLRAGRQSYWPKETGLRAVRAQFAAVFPLRGAVAYERPRGGAN